MGRLSVAFLFVAFLILAPVATVGAGAAASHAENAPSSVAQSGPNPCVGTVTEEPDRPTVVSIQGARGSDKTDAMLVSFAPSGEVIGVHNEADNGRWWAYDVDRLGNGNFLMPTTQNSYSIVEEIEGETGEHVSTRHFEGVHDAHDVDLINGDELVVNDMGDEHNRVLVYNITREEVVWEYRFDDHNDVFPREGGGEYGEDWTHNNDVDQIKPGVFMVSVRNFDQVVAINRSTKEVEWALGEDDNATILDEQHNPDYIETDDGRETVLVADSLNDRVVEYTREGDSWNRTWVLEGGGLNEPRDADRLPSGNTLVSDRRGDRLLEVTPDGEVLWEVYTPWQPYDAERLGTVDESSGPAMVDAGTTGTYEMTGYASFETADVEDCYAFLRNVSSSRLVPEDDPGVVTDVFTTATEASETDTTATSDDTPETSAPATAGDSDSVLGTTAAESGGPGAIAIVAAGAVLLLVIGIGGAFLRQRE